MSRDDRFVTIEVTHDPIRAEVIRDLLAQEGIAATAPGVQQQNLIMAALEITIQVRERDTARARAIIDAMGEYDAVIVDDDLPPVPSDEMGRRLDREDDEGDMGEGPYRSAPGPTEVTDQRLKRLAVMSALGLTFGSGHFYARDHRGGLLLLVTQVLVLFVVFGGDTRAFAAVPILMAADILGSIHAVHRYNTGERTSGARWLLRTAPALAVVLCVVLYGVPAVRDRAWPVEAAREETRQLCHKFDRCTAEGPGDPIPEAIADCVARMEDDLESRRVRPPRLRDWAARTDEPCVDFLSDVRGY